MRVRPSSAAWIAIAIAAAAFASACANEKFVGGDEPPDAASDASGDAEVADEGAAEPIQLVAKNGSAFKAGGANVQLAVSPRAGDLLVAGVFWNMPATQFTVSDSADNIWNSADAQEESAGGANVQIWYALDVKAGALTVTAAPIASVDAGTGGAEMFVLEYSGVRAKDVAAEAFGAMETAFDVPVTTTSPGDVVVGLFSGYNSASNNAPGAGNGFVAEQGDPVHTVIFEDNAPGYAAPLGKLDVTATSPAPSFTTWAGMAVTFSPK
ncbi:MAG: hypothetical protein ACRELY_19470 [Polyangiaceae bacterium]